MKPTRRKATSPAEILVTEFIEPLGMPEVAKRLGMTIEEVVALTANHAHHCQHARPGIGHNA